MTDRVPADPDLERSVLGAVLLTDRVLKPLVLNEHLNPETFYNASHGDVFAAMLAIANRGGTIDVFSVRAEMQRRGHTDDADGLGRRLDMLLASVVAAGNAREHARRLVELAEQREVLKAAYELIAGINAEDAETLAAAERRLAQRGRGDTATVTGEQMRDEVWSWIQSPDEPEAFPFPWQELNDAMGGLRRQETTFVGAWTNHGKSPLVDQMLDHAASTGARCHLYANEGNRLQRELRNVARRADVNLSRLERKRLHPAEGQKVADALRDPLPFGYTDCAGWTAEEIARHMRWNRADLVAVDLLHNIEHHRTSELDSIVLALTQAAVLSDCHLLLVGQLNEERAKAEELPPPVLRDIRGSGMIKNLSSNVLFLFREQEVDEETGITRLTSTSRVYLQKVRYGQLGGALLDFIGSRQLFRRPISHERSAA